MALLLLVVSAWFWAGESAPHGERASATSRGVFPPCPNELVIQHERLFKRLLKAVFTTQGVLLEGSIIDAGANDGSESCHFAEWQPQRLVHAIEPLLENLKHIRKFGKHRPNLRPFHGGLGNTSTWVRAVAPGGSGVTAQVSLLSSKPKARAADSLQSEEHASSFFIHRVDDLFANRWSRERLAFAHWDVEGLELAVVHGAWHTLRLHRPVITVEMFVNRALKQGQQLLRLIAEAVYDCFLVEEPCGLPCVDTRTELCSTCPCAFRPRRSHITLQVKSHPPEWQTRLPQCHLRADGAHCQLPQASCRARCRASSPDHIRAFVQSGQARLSSLC